MMKVANLDHIFCPGHVHTKYLSAITKLFWITLYLTFQFVVIATFGRATNSSSFNQTLATIAGGFLPYVLKKYVMKNDSPPSLDANNIAWKFQLEEMIKQFEERWYLADLVLSDHMEVTEQNVNVNTRQDDIDLIVKHTVKVQANGKQDEKWEFWCNKKSPSAAGRKKEHREDAGGEALTNDPNVTDGAIKQKTTRFITQLPGSTTQNIETENHTSKKKK